MPRNDFELTVPSLYSHLQYQAGFAHKTLGQGDGSLNPLLDFSVQAKVDQAS